MRNAPLVVGAGLMVLLATRAPCARAEETPATSSDSRPWAGMGLADPDGAKGVRVTKVFRGSPAARAGVGEGDRVVAVGSQPVNSAARLVETIRRGRPGDRIRLRVQREEKERVLDVILESAPDGEELLRRQWVGEHLPSLKVESAYGAAPVRLDGLRGRVVVLAFRATWCSACAAAAPALDAWHRRYEAQGLTVLGVDAEPVEVVAAHEVRRATRHPVVADPAGEVSRLLSISSVPTFFVVDRAGTVRHVAVGFDPVGMGAAQKLVERLLDEPRTSGR